MQPNLEDLHRQASGHYLKGDFAAAVTAWRQVLDLKPDDERAREGIRLCEQLTDCVDPSQVPMDPSHDSPGPPPEAPTEAAPETAEEAQVVFELSRLGEEPASEGTSGAPVDHDTDVETTTVVDPVTEPSAESPEPVADEVVAEPAGESPEPAVDETVANELRRRIDELLVEARTLVEKGEPDAALRTLDRVLILDEENEAAITLRDSIAPSTAKPEPAAEAPVPDLAVDLEDNEASGADEASPAPEQDAGEGAPIEAPAEAEAPVAAEAEAEAEPVPAASAGASRFSMASLPPWLRDTRVLLGAGGLLVVAVLAVAYLVLDGRGAPTADVAVAAEPVAAEPVAASTEPEAPTEADPAPAALPGDADTLMQEAEAAFEAENYGQAVIAYDRVLKLVPDHVEAGVKMKVAAERYREQQERQERWDDAVAAFEEANYAEALRLFYRFPKDAYEADVDRFKVNGWYNLAVQALQSKDCDRAIEHLEEARQIAPHDDGVLTALELAEICRGRAVFADMKRLQFRAMSD
jgi:tetratricopeptide (TPR) repeat protein